MSALLASSSPRRLVYCALLLASCAGRRPAPPPAPSIDDPVAIVPADLDLVLRLDLGRVRDALGPGALDELKRRAVRPGPGASALLLDALGQSNLLWVGARPGADLKSSDFVWVMRGHYPAFDPHRGAAFGAPDDLGGALRRYDRVARSERADPARFYLHGDDLVVAATAAELDSVERTLELGRREPALEPPSKGLLSIAVRPSALLRRLPAGAGQLRKLAEHALSVEGSADVTSAGVAVEFALELADGASAERLARALGELKEAVADEPRFGAWAKRVSIEHVDAFVTAHATFERHEIALLFCAMPDSGC